MRQPALYAYTTKFRPFGVTYYEVELSKEVVAAFEMRRVPAMDRAEKMVWH